MTISTTRMSWQSALTLSAVLALPAFAVAADYKLTGENTTVKFLGTKKDGQHEGGFKKLSGTLAVPDDIAKSTLAVTIDINSLWSDNEKLTAHLKAPDFFEAKRFPEAKFVSTSIKADKDGYLVTGELTMHGKTKPLTFPAKIAKSAAGVTLDSKFKLKRSEWDITYGAGMIDEDVQMTIAVKAK